MDKTNELVEEIIKYWRYYSILEDDLLSIEQYISFEDANLNTYSNQLLKLFQIICSEVDAFLKIFCVFYDSKVEKKENRNMYFYKKTIKKYYPKLAKTTISLKRETPVKFQP